MLAALLSERGAFVAFVSGRLRDLGAAAAEEIVQEAFVKAVSHEGELRDPAAGRAWFYGILRNAIVDARRRGAVAERAHGQILGESEPASEPPTPRAACRCIAAAVSGLKDEYRAAIAHVVAEDEPLASFAERSGLSRNHAAVRVHRAKKALAATVKTTCGACAGEGCRDCTCAR